MTVRRFFTPLRLAISGILIVIAEMAYMWSLQMILLKRGDTDPEWCPAPPENVPPETGFSYEVSYFPPTVDCSVNSKEANWESAQSTVLSGCVIMLVLGISLIIGSLVWALIRERRTQVA